MLVKKPLSEAYSQVRQTRVLCPLHLIQLVRRKQQNPDHIRTIRAY
jgi:hypothetical protein